MGLTDVTSQSVDYRLIMISGDSQDAWAERTDGGFSLPRVTIPRYARPAEELQIAAAARWKMQIVIVDLLPETSAHGHCAIAEILGTCPDPLLVPVPLAQLELKKIAPDECVNIPLSSPGWTHIAMEWLQSAVNHPVPFTGRIRQLNAAGGFVLARFEMEREPSYWLKAVSGQNAHEFDITRMLAVMCPEFLPPIVGWSEPWNAWWMEEAGEPVSLWTVPKLARAASTMAALQKKAIEHSAELLNAGASDHRLPSLRERVGEIFEYLAEAMAMPTSTKVFPIERRRLRELSQITEDICHQMEALQIPDTIFSTDIQTGNILFNNDHCVFIDWCESAVGNPFAAFEYLCLLEPGQRGEWIDDLREAYRTPWREQLTDDQIDRAFALAPVLAILSCLYGRGTWLHTPDRNDAARQRYARSLARHLDRAARKVSLSEVTCR